MCVGLYQSSWEYGEDIFIVTEQINGAQVKRMSWLDLRITWKLVMFLKMFCSLWF